MSCQLHLQLPLSSYTPPSLPTQRRLFLSCLSSPPPLCLRFLGDLWGDLWCEDDLWDEDLCGDLCDDDLWDDDLCGDLCEEEDEDLWGDLCEEEDEDLWCLSLCLCLLLLDFWGCRSLVLCTSPPYTSFSISAVKTNHNLDPSCFICSMQWIWILDSNTKINLAVNLNIEQLQNFQLCNEFEY